VLSSVYNLGSLIACDEVFIQNEVKRNYPKCTFDIPYSVVSHELAIAKVPSATEDIVGCQDQVLLLK
jgi:hypothetical protein